MTKRNSTSKPDSNTTPSPTLPAPTRSADVSEAKPAFEKLEPLIRAYLDHPNVEPPRYDVNRASALALGTAERVAPFRDAIAASCKLTDIRVLDELPEIALAAWYAALRVTNARDEERRIPGLLEEARPLREDLLQSAELLARFGLVDPNRVAEIRAGQGNLDMAADLVQLAALFEASWSEVAGKTPVTEAMLRRASALGADLQRAIGNDPAERPAAEAVSLRNAAFTLLLERYEEVRRAVTYLRWNEGDADLLAPSLFTARRRARASRDAAPESTDTASAPEAPPAPVAQEGEPRGTLVSE